MASKTSLLEAVRTFDWKAVDTDLQKRPDLLGHREERGKNWLHVLCSTRLKGRKPAASIKTADVLLEHGIDLHAHAFTEGTWKATPVWWCVSWGRNLALAEHLLKLGATADYSLFAACWNDDVAALDLLLKYGALVDDATSGRETPFLGAITWSRFPLCRGAARARRGCECQERKGADRVSHHAEEGIGLPAFRDAGEARCARGHPWAGWENRDRDHVAHAGRAVSRSG